MARFILIDSSVKGAGGHHFEYAGRILDAAKAEGYKTLLLAHRDYDKARWPIDHEVKPAFTNTFWDHFVHYYVKKQPRKLGLRPPRFLYPLARWWRREVLRFRFSSSGLAYERARNYRLREIPTLGFTTHDLSSVPSSRTGMLLARVTISLRAFALTMLGKAQQAGRVVVHSLRWLAFLLLAPFAIVLGPLFLLRPKQDPARAFADEIDRALRVGKIEADDIIFVPNATAAELRGLALLRARRSKKGDLHWAFLFRRPVFDGYAEDYQRQGEAARLHRLQFAALQRVAPDARLSFYTDTDQLTEQYDRLGVYKFHTLPVPVDPALAQRPKQAHDPLVIGYIGDARDEKGFQHLPRLVDHLDSDPATSGRVRFLFQSNFNVPDGETETRHAKRILQHARPGLVELVEGPFDQKEYAALARRIDMLLIPYAAHQYSARSSGVLAEAVAAGVPAIAPARTSMAALIEPYRQAHLAALFQSPSVRLVGAEAVTRLAGRTRKLQAPEDAKYLLVRVAMPEAPERYVAINVAFHNRAGVQLGAQTTHCWATTELALAAFEIPAGTRVSVSIEVHGLGVLERSTDVQAHFFASDADVTLHAGVALFESPERDFVTAVRDVAVHYTAYRAAAEHLHEQLTAFYSPSELVRRLAQYVRQDGSTP